jgi:hypothetical protein
MKPPVVPFPGLAPRTVLPRRLSMLAEAKPELKGAGRGGRLDRIEELRVGATK